MPCRARLTSGSSCVACAGHRFSAIDDPDTVVYLVRTLHVQRIHIHESPGNDSQPRFLVHFADHGGFRVLAEFHAAAGQRPATGQVRQLRGDAAQQYAVAVCEQPVGTHTLNAASSIVCHRPTKLPARRSATARTPSR